MKLNKMLSVLLILGATSLFGGNLNEIGVLVEKINKTTDQKAKTKLLNELDEKIELIDKKDLKKAREIINKNLINK